jgi:carbon storage regulator
MIADLTICKLSPFDARFHRGIRDETTQLIAAAFHTAAIQGRRSSRMLVLSRQRDESIIIGDNIVITIVDIRGDKVRLGIEAPREIPVHRQEVYDAIQSERSSASSDDSAQPVGENSEATDNANPS